MSGLHEIQSRLGVIQADILKYSDRPDDVELVAVSKRFGPEYVLAASELGVRSFGENYAQELIAKDAALENQSLAWHFIGSLQRNKIKKLAGLVAVWHTIDSESLVKEIAKRSPNAAVFLQLNSTQEPQKSGCSLGEIEELSGVAVDAGLNVLGLMSMGPSDGTDPSKAFKLAAEMNSSLGFSKLSLGMTSDYPLALELGATHLRIGSGLFGERPN